MGSYTPNGRPATFRPCLMALVLGLLLGALGRADGQGCAAGTYAVAGACSACAISSYQSRSATSSCTLCGGGAYQTGMGATTCVCCASSTFLTGSGMGSSAVAITVGYTHTCAMSSNGSVECWGYNDYGQLGIGSNSWIRDQAGEMGDSLQLVQLGTGRTAVAIAAGGHHTCALLNCGSVACWGRNYEGQLGISSTYSVGDQSREMGNSLQLVQLGTGRTAVAISAGYYHTCAMSSNGSVACWGYNGRDRQHL